jgi:hypothetical protein
MPQERDVLVDVKEDVERVHQKQFACASKEGEVEMWTARE